MTDYIFATLLFLHILAVVGWMGAALLFSSVLGPSIKTMTPSGRAEFLTKTISRYTNYIFATSIGAVVFGLALYAYAFRESLIPIGNAATLIQAGAGLGLVALILSLAVVMPSARNLVRMLKETQTSTPPPGSQEASIVSAIQRVRMGTGIVAGLLFIVLILMVFGANFFV